MTRVTGMYVARLTPLDGPLWMPVFFRFSMFDGGMYACDLAPAAAPGDVTPPATLRFRSCGLDILDRSEERGEEDRVRRGRVRPAAGVLLPRHLGLHPKPGGLERR